MIKKFTYGIIAAFLAGVYEGIFVGFTYLIIFSLALLMTLWSDIVAFHSGQGKKMRAVTITRTMKDAYCRKNQWVEINLTMLNNGRSSVAFNYFDSLSDVFNARGSFKGYVVLKPGETRKISYEISPQAVGKYFVGPVNMYAEDPFRLCVLNYIAERATEMHVSPSIGEIYGARADRLSNIRFTEGIHRSRTVGQGYNFYGIRPYADMDDMRYVSWSRYGLVNGEDIYIKQMEEERQIDVYFVIDYSLSTNFGHNAKRMYDRFIVNSINAGYSILRNHDGVGYILLSSDINVNIKPTRSQVSINMLEKEVSELRPSGEFDLPKALETIRTMVKKSSLVILITPLSGEKKFSLPKVSLIQKGKQITIFLVSPSEFMDVDGLDPSYRKILFSGLVQREAELKAQAAMIRVLGVQCHVVQESHLFPRLMLEYGYGRIVR